MLSEPPLGPRNPVAELPAWRKIRALSPEARAAIAALILEIEADTNARANISWRLNKAPMAAYWKSVSHYMRYFHLALHQRD